MWRALPLFLLLACGNKNNTPAPADDPKTDEGATDGTEDGGAEDGENGEGAEDGEEDGGAEKPETPTPESLYAECKERVEGPQAEGECTKDEDCKTAGCGTEVCTTVAEAANIMTTCEGKLCFKILDTCGCNEGMCSWSLKAEIPAAKPGPGGKPGPKPLPPTRLPPSPPPAEGGN